jgi:hypothetical protein
MDNPVERSHISATFRLQMATMPFTTADEAPTIATSTVARDATTTVVLAVEFNSIRVWG